MPAIARGLKRTCTSCEMKFYDFNKRPVICPSCDVEFTGAIRTKMKRRGGAATTPTPTKPKEEAVDATEITVEDGADDAVSLDDAAAAEQDTQTDDDDVELVGDLDLDELENIDDQDDNDENLDDDNEDLTKIQMDGD